MDGIIIAHETIHFLKSSKKKGVIMKLDMSKAFDMIRWDFISKALRAFGVCTRWIHWIMNLVLTLFLSILINGVPSTTFKSSREI